ncbi:MAG: hypothetical protein Q8S54_14995 [Bacteroidota bacterium]|nr:hypothetical protein [Bacteroidota bacterium]
MKKKFTLVAKTRIAELKNFSKPVLLALIALVMTINTAKATGSTIIWIPSVDFQAFKTMHLGIDNYIRTSKDNGVRGAGIYDFGLTFGALHLKKFQIEVGVDYLTMGDNVYDDQPIYFNTKGGFAEGSLFKNSPAIAIGGYNFGTKNNLTNYNIAYGVIGKTLPIIGRLSVGYYIGNEKLLLDSKGAKANSGVLASWDRPMKEISDKLWLAVDYQGGKNYLGALNLGFSWNFSSNVSVIFGYDIYNDSKTLYNSTNTNKNTFTTQLDINF